MAVCPSIRDLLFCGSQRYNEPTHPRLRVWVGRAAGSGAMYGVKSRLMLNYEDRTLSLSAE